MGKVMDEPQREQAGSDSYNRFEYQVFWITDHIIEQLVKKNFSIVFCEYHDDMAEIPNRLDKNKFEFYQVKTKESNDSTEWSIVDVSKKAKRNNGTYKKSFLGFIFYNFLKFEEECQKCHFVSNMKFDQEILTWQAFIEDGYNLKYKNRDIYEKIKKRIKDEYPELNEKEFDECFERFIQNTFLYKADLGLDSYEKEVSGEFFKYLAYKSIPTNAANLMFDQIVNDVRKKSKEEIEVPISEKRLLEKKAIDTKVISEILDEKVREKNEYIDFRKFLCSLSEVDGGRIDSIISAKINHDIKWLDTENITYQELILEIRKHINEFLIINKNYDIQNIKRYIFDNLESPKYLIEYQDNELVEVLVYEKKFRESRKTVL